MNNLEPLSSFLKEKVGKVGKVIVDPQAPIARKIRLPSGLSDGVNSSFNESFAGFLLTLRYGFCGVSVEKYRQILPNMDVAMFSKRAQWEYHGKNE